MYKQRMTDKVIEMVTNYTLDVSEENKYKEFSVYVVWHCYILGNQKWLLATTLPDDMYYEVTYNKVKDEFYFDAYKKIDNYCCSNTIQNDRI